ncbi:hypothetical protein E9993_07380 [Labilibacter sediminis]|nr:hypothetical protein E9993_07380 [Labilibacter sediminis]
MVDEKVLILGAGKVAGPIVKYLLNSGYRVTVASEFLYQSEYVIQNHPLGRAVEWHAGDQEKLNALVSAHKVVVSLLPFFLHIDVCKACIKAKRSLITTSYEQPGMAELHSEACKSNITILNEMGLDPGIDHMWAAQMLDAIKAQGGRVVKFISVCGALPSPESLDNPFRYKFSWSPMGVMRASMSEASYLKNGEVIRQGAANLFRNTFELNVEGVGSLEAYANRDSIKYIELYQIPEVKTFFRGTFRYKGWCETLATLIDAGYLGEEEFPNNVSTYGELAAYLMKLKPKENVRDVLADKMNVATHSNSILAMEWLGLFSNVRFSAHLKTPLSVLTDRMVSKMKMLPSDKDMVVLNHQLLYELPDKSRKIKNGSMVMMGMNSENTAIADTVSLPPALAVELLLNNTVAHKGVIRPLCKEIYEPILNQLTKKMKFTMNEKELGEDQWPKDW